MVRHIPGAFSLGGTDTGAGFLPPQKNSKIRPKAKKRTIIDITHIFPEVYLSKGPQGGSKNKYACKPVLGKERFGQIL